MWKLFLLQIILSLLIFSTLGNDELFAKFYQTQYKIKDFRIEVDYYNPDVYRVFEIKTYKYNRSVPAANLTAVHKIDVNGTNIEALVQVYKFASNEYRHFPVRFQANIWKAINLNIVGLKVALKCGNFPVDTFYFQKNVVYHVCNAIPDDTRFPPLIPTGRFKAQVTMFIGNVKLATASGFGEIYIPIKFED